MKVVNADLKTRLKISFSVTSLLIFINIFLFLLTLLLTIFVFEGNNSFTLLVLGAQVLPTTNVNLSVFVTQFYRFLTSAFLHDGIFHILFNMYALNHLGGYVEEVFGGKKLFITYVFSAIFASLLSFLIGTWNLYQTQFVDSSIAISVGASGAIFGLVGLLLGYKIFRRRTSEIDINVNTRSLLFIVAVNLLLGFSLNIFDFGFSVNNYAHLGGFLAGLLLGGSFKINRSINTSKARYVLVQILFILSIIITIVSVIFSILNILSVFLPK